MQDHVPTLGELDRDGALEEAAAKVGISRAQLFRRSAFVGGGLVIGGLPAALSIAQDVAASDVDILNYALTLEYLEAAFYDEALQKGALSGQLERFARTAGEHENAHVEALRDTLGGDAIKRPSFDFKGTTENEGSFGQTAMVLEDTGVKAYQGQAPRIKSDEILKAALAIHPVEARHAAWIASILSNGSGSPSPAPAANNPAADMATVLAAVQSTGFITREQAAQVAQAINATPSVAG